MKSELLYLSRADVEAVGLSMKEVIDAVTLALTEKGRGRVEMPPKPGIHTAPDAFIHAMPAYLPAIEAAGIKWVAGFPENPGRGLPYVTGLIVLNDPHVGLPLAVLDATWITAMRTGAATAVAARHLARRDAKTLAILGCGVQGRSNALALQVELPALELLRVYDARDENARRYADEMKTKLRLRIEPVPSAEAAVRDADVVVTAGPILKAPRPVIAYDWLREGAFVCTLDFDSYVKGETWKRADKLATDDAEQLRYYRSVGYFQEVPDPYADLGELVTGARPGREDSRERILCANLGLAIEDMAVALRVYERARAGGIGRRLPL